MKVNTRFLKARREKLGLTQEKAAKLAGIGTRFHWSRIETGARKTPHLTTLSKIAKALNCKVQQLLQEP